MAPLLHRVRLFHTSSSSSHSNRIGQSDAKRLHKNRNITSPASILVETEVIADCYRCDPQGGLSHGEEAHDGDAMIDHASDRSSPFTDRRNVATTKSPRKTASHSYLHGTRESPKRQQAKIDPALENEIQKLTASGARLESEVKEHAEFLRLLKGRREKLAAEGEKLRRSGSPGTETQDRNATSWRSSPSAARRACQEAYAKMTPTQHHLMKDKLHWDGIRRRNLKREEEERVDWDRFQHSCSPRADKSTPDREKEEEEERKRAQRSQDEVQILKMKLQKKQKRQPSESWELYENSWKKIVDLRSTPDYRLTFIHIPWPISNVFLPHPDSKTIDTNDAFFDTIFSADTISSFLFSMHHPEEKSKRQRLHDALLRYHPDRFENHVLCFIEEGERMVTKLAMRRVAGVLNSMLNDC